MGITSLRALPAGILHDIFLSSLLSFAFPSFLFLACFLVGFHVKARADGRLGGNAFWKWNRYRELAYLHSHLRCFLGVRRLDLVREVSNLFA